jgi:Rhodopirellula transposase DDE domain
MGQRWHRPRHRDIRGEREPSLVAGDGEAELCPRHAADGHCRGGGSNGYLVRLWKVELQKLADELKLPITVCHCHFSFITSNWRGKPLRVAGPTPGRRGQLPAPDSHRT